MHSRVESSDEINIEKITSTSSNPKCILENSDLLLAATEADLSFHPLPKTI